MFASIEVKRGVAGQGFVEALAMMERVSRRRCYVVDGLDCGARNGKRLSELGGVTLVVDVVRLGVRRLKCCRSTSGAVERWVDVVVVQLGSWLVVVRGGLATFSLDELWVFDQLRSRCNGYKQRPDRGG